MLRPLTIALTLLAAPALAQNVAFGGMTADTSAPVEVAADNLAVDQADGSAVFTGNVVIGQGEMRLAADSVTVIYAEGGQNRIQALKAQGNVTLTSGKDAAQSETADYDVASGNIALAGAVVLSSDRGAAFLELSGERTLTITYSKDRANAGQVLSAVQASGLSIVDVVTRDPDLEDVFLHLTAAA